MVWEAWFTLGVVAFVMVVLIMTRIASDIVLMGGLTLLLVSGVLRPHEALTGFSNEGMITVGVLYFVVAGLSETGAIGWVVHNLLGRVKSLASAQVKMMLPVMAMSAFLNNTAVVAIMIQAVNRWARQNRISVSKLFIPLSYASIFGGTCTLIGTTTNLVVNGFLIEQPHVRGIGMFELAWVGLPCAAVGLLVVVALSPHFLPERKPAVSEYDDLRDYTVEMVVDPASTLVGQTVEEAGLNHLPGMYLAEIGRTDHIIATVHRNVRLLPNDRLVFVGIVDSVLDLLKVRGLKPATDQIFKLDAPRSERLLIEAVVSASGPLVGKTVSQGRFRSVYDAVIIAVARGGERLTEKIGNVALKPGDTLLLEGPPSFVEQQRNSRDFYLISALDEQGTPRHERAPIAVAILLFMVASVSLGWLSMLKAAMLAAGFMVITKCLTGGAARRSIDWQVLLTIGASFGIGHAIQSTGAAEVVGQSVISLAGSSPWLSLALVYAVTSLFTAMITNNAAAVLMFPIALATADTLEVSVMPFAVAIMMAASASFASPIGYQTNLMVFGPGGYRFSDYLRLGLPLNVVLGALSIGLIPLIWKF